MQPLCSIKFVYPAFISLSATSLWLFIVITAFAHTSGFYVEKIVGDYLLDVGYSSEVLMEDTQIRFDFAIYDKDKTREIDFSEVWVRIEEDDRLLFAGGLNKARFGATGLAYSFAEGGNYKVSVRFSGATSTLAEGEFDFTVFAEPLPLRDQSWFKAVIYTSIPWAVAMLALFAYFVLRKKKESGATLKTHPNRAWLPVALNTALFLGLVVVGYLLAAKASYLLDLFIKFFA